MTSKPATTYTEAQYSTPSAHAMIIEWLGAEPTHAHMETVSRYMSKTLRIGGIKVCRALVLGAMQSHGLTARECEHVSTYQGITLPSGYCAKCGLGPNVVKETL